MLTKNHFLTAKMTSTSYLDIPRSFKFRKSALALLLSRTERVQQYYTLSWYSHVHITFHLYKYTIHIISFLKLKSSWCLIFHSTDCSIQCYISICSPWFSLHVLSKDNISLNSLQYTRHPTVGNLCFIYRR